MADTTGMRFKEDAMQGIYGREEPVRERTTETNTTLTDLVFHSNAPADVKIQHLKDAFAAIVKKPEANPNERPE